MSENVHNIDKLFRDGIEGQEEMPSPNIWSELDKKLDKKKVDSIAGKYYKLKWVAAALFIFSFAMGMYVYHVHKNSELVKNSSSREPASGIPTEKKHADAAIKSADMTAESKKNTLDEKPPVRSVETDSLLNKDLPAETPPRVNSQLPGKAATVVYEKEKLQHDPAQKELTRISAQKDQLLLPANHQQEQGSGSEDIRVKKIQDNTSSLVKNTPHPQKAAGKTNNRNATDDRQQKTGKEDVVQSVQKDKEQHNIPGSQADRPDLRAVFLPLDLPVMTHPETTVWKSFSKLDSPVPVQDLPSGNAAGYVQITQPRKTGFTTTVFFSPNAVSNNVASNNSAINTTIGPPRMGQNYPQSVKDKEQNGSSWSAGALLGYHFNERWSIESGLVLTTRITVIAPKTIVARPDDHGNIKYLFDCSSGFVYIDLKQNSAPVNGDSANAVSSKNKLQYLSVPIIMKYSFGNGKLRVNTGFGLQTNFLVSHNIDTYITKGNTREYAKTGELQGLRPVYISGLLSAGVSYKLSNIFTASVTPNAQIGLMSINGNAPVKSYISFYGIAAGIAIKL